jgi:hypothetical protein
VWAAPAASATSVIVNDTTTNASMFPTWVTASSGNLPLKVSSTKLSFNPSSGTLATTAVTASSSVTIGAGTGSYTSNVNALTVISGGNTPTFFSMDTSATDLTLGWIWIEANNPHTGNGTFSTIAFTGHRVSPSNDAVQYASIAGVFADQTAQTGDLAFVLRYVGNHMERVRFKGDGTVGIGTASPVGLLHLLGTRSLSAWGTTGAVLRVQSGTVTDTSSSGTVANAEINTFSQPTIAASSATTFTNASTLFLSAAPVAGTNVTITTAWALKVAAGAAGLDGGVSVNAGALGTARSFAVDRVAGNGTRSLEYNFVFGTNSGFQLTADVTSQRNWYLAGSTFTGNAATRTITNYATLYIESAGTAGANAAITNNYAFWVDAGASRFDGSVGIGVTLPLALLHLAAGTATANTAPLKLTSGTNLTTAEAGAVEYNGTNLFFTRAGTVRENVLVAIDNVAAPTTNAGTPTTRYGGDTKYLGDPDRWLSVNVLGATYKIPLYN